MLTGGYILRMFLVTVLPGRLTFSAEIGSVHRVPPKRQQVLLIHGRRLVSLESDGLYASALRPAFLVAAGSCRSNRLEISETGVAVATRQ